MGILSGGVLAGRLSISHPNNARLKGKRRIPRQGESEGKEEKRRTTTIIPQHDATHFLLFLHYIEHLAGMEGQVIIPISIGVWGGGAYMHTDLHA